MRLRQVRGPDFEIIKNREEIVRGFCCKEGMEMDESEEEGGREQELDHLLRSPKILDWVIRQGNCVGWSR